MSDADDLKAPVRKTAAKPSAAKKTAKKPAATATPARRKAPIVRAPRQSSNVAGRIVLMALFIAVGAGAMYMAMPMLAKKDARAPAGGAPAAGGKGGAPDAAAMQLPVEAMKVEARPMMQSVTVTASLAAQEQADIRAEISGRVVAIPFKEGAPVKKGDILFRLDDSVQQAQLAQAQADAALTRNNVRRYKELHNSRAIAGVQVEEAQAQLNTATANAALAKANIDKTTIRAPFDGVAGIRNTSVGAVVDASQQLVTVTQTTPLRVVFELPEKFLPAVQKDQIVRFTVASHPDRVFEAKVNATDSAIDTQSRAVRVQAQVDNKDGALLAGQFATLSFALNTQTQALAIPDSAIMPEGGQFSVYKIGTDGAVQKTPVRIGLRDGTYSEVLEGLAAGDQVVTAGQQKLFPGMKVKAMPPSQITVKPSPEQSGPAPAGDNFTTTGDATQQNADAPAADAPPASDTLTPAQQQPATVATAPTAPQQSAVATPAPAAPAAAAPVATPVPVTAAPPAGEVQPAKDEGAPAAAADKAPPQ